MALLDSKGLTPDGSAMSLPVAGPLLVTRTPLAANSKFDSGICPYHGATTIDIQIVSDVAGAYQLKFYDKDNVEMSFLPALVSYDPTSGMPYPFPFQTTLNYKGYGMRIIYTNGPVAQSQFMLAVNFGQSSQETQQSVATAITDTNKASVGKTTLQGKQDSTGTRREVTVTSSGNKNAVDVNVVNPTTATDVSALAKDVTLTNGTQKVQVTNPTPATDVSALAKDTTLTGGTQKTQVTNFPTTQQTSPVPTTTNGYPSKGYYQPSGTGGGFTLIATGARKLGAMHITNTNSSPIIVMLYDKATSPVSGDTAVQAYAIPANTGMSLQLGVGVNFTNGIGIGAAVGTSLLNLVSALLTSISPGSITVNYSYI